MPHEWRDGDTKVSRNCKRCHPRAQIGHGKRSFPRAWHSILVPRTMPCTCWDYMSAFVHIQAAIPNIQVTADSLGKQLDIPEPFKLKPSWETEKKVVGDYSLLILNLLCISSAPT